MGQISISHRRLLGFWTVLGNLTWAATAAPFPPVVHSGEGVSLQIGDYSQPPEWAGLPELLTSRCTIRYPGHLIQPER